MRLLLGLALLAAPLPVSAQTAPAADVAVAVLARPIARGERIDTADLASEDRAPAVARGALAAGDIAGMEAVRNLSAGAIVRRGDVMPVQLVRRGEPVTIRLVSGGLVIATAGRALGGGGQGALVRVVTTSTSRTLDAVVEGTGAVRVMAP